MRNTRNYKTYGGSFEMKMKKILALVMALVLVLSLAACQNSSGSTTGGD